MSPHQHEHDQCHDLLGYLSDYVDGELEEALCLQIELHMAECENCRVVVDTLRRTVSLYHALPPEPIPEEVEARLFRRLDLSEFVRPG